MSKIKTILFDLDGTLINTTDIILSTFVDTFKHFMPELSIGEKELTNFLGQTLFTTFGFYVDSKEKVDEMVTYYRVLSNKKIEDKLEAFPKAKETIQYLKSKNIQVGVVTSKMHSVAKYHLELTHLFDDLDVLIGYEDTTKHKPDGEPILNALKALNAKPHSTVYIGDHENDMLAAKHAGVISCAVTYSPRILEMLHTQPDYVIDELDNVKDLI
jgi:HAD superfamily hydrolase (TIGR01662 family)